MKHWIAAIVAYFLVDLTWGRAYLSIAIGFIATAAVYLVALPDELPTWPGLLALVLSGLIGIVWENASAC